MTQDPTPVQPLCSFCFHAFHPPGERCQVLVQAKQCKCKGKRSWLGQFFDGLGTGAGEAKFGG